MLISDRIASGRSHGGSTITAQPLYVVLDLVTHPLPAHRVVWMLLPAAFTLAAACLIGWSVARLTTPWAGRIAGVLAVAVTPDVLGSMLVQGFHGLTWFCDAVLFAFIVSVLRSRSAARPRILVAAGIIAIAIGFSVASDKFLLFTGAIPLGVTALTVLAMGVRHRELIGRGLFLISTTAAIAITSLIANAVFHGTQLLIPKAPGKTGLAPLSDVWTHVTLGARGFVTLTGGTVPSDRRTGLLSIAMATRATLFAAAALVVLAFVVLEARTLLRTELPARASATVYWSCAAAIVVAAFIFSRVAVDVGSGHYLIPFTFALVVLASMHTNGDMRRRWISVIAVVIATVIAAADVFAFAYGGVEKTPDRERFPALIAFLDAHHLRRGYGNYWDANAISWKTHDRIEILPVFEGCFGSDKGTLCPYYWEVNRNAFLPVAGRTFVIVKPGATPSEPPTERLFGRPTRVLHIDHFDVYVYPYDVASRFLGRPTATSS